MKLAEVIYHLATDDDFRGRMMADPRAALAAAYPSLKEEELEVLGSMSWNTLLSASTPSSIVPVPEWPGWWGCQFNNHPIQPRMSTTG